MLHQLWSPAAALQAVWHLFNPVDPIVEPDVESEGSSAAWLSDDYLSSIAEETEDEADRSLNRRQQAPDLEAGGFADGFLPQTSTDRRGNLSRGSRAFAHYKTTSSYQMRKAAEHNAVRHRAAYSKKCNDLHALEEGRSINVDIFDLP